MLIEDHPTVVGILTLYYPRDRRQSAAASSFRALPVFRSEGFLLRTDN
jgi:hypothetical protein